MAASCGHGDFKGRNQWDGVFVEDTISLTPGATYDIGNHMIDSITYVILEYLDDYPVGTVNSLLFMEEYIVVVDQRAANAVYLFSYDGKFRRQISSQGTGPGEYVNLTHVTLSPDRRQIVIQDRAAKKMMWFDINGRLTRTREIPQQSGDIEFINDNTWVSSIYPMTRNVTRKGHCPFFVVTDSLWNFKYALDYPRKFHEPYHILPTPLRCSSSGEIFGNIARDHRLYKFTPDSLYVTYRFLFEGQDNDRDWEELVSMDNDSYFNDNYTLMHPVMDCGDWISFNLRNGDSGCLALYHKSERKTYYIDMFHNGNVMYSFLNHIGFCNRNTLIAMADANTFYSNTQFLDRKENPLFFEIADRVNAESNPVLVFFHLKQ